MVNEYFKKQLRNYLKRFNEFRSSVEKNTGFDLEQNTTIKFVVPLLNILGWQHLQNDMGCEYPVNSKKESNRIRCDIALYTDYSKSKKPKILVEIKRIQAPKFESGRYLLRYLNATKIDYGIFTDGKELKLVDRRTPARSNPEGLFSLKVNDFSNYADVLWILSKEMVAKSKLDEFAYAYHFKPKFFHWAESEKIKSSELKKYKLRLEFARRFLNKTL